MGYAYPRPTRHKLVVKRGLSGLGLFASSPIKRGDFILEYWGPRIDDKTADKKGGKYIFELENNANIDGSIRKNTARYINHSCKPNCYAELDGKRMFIYAKRKILPGEEITYHYGKPYWEEYIGKKCRCSSCLDTRHRK